MCGPFAACRGDRAPTSNTMVIIIGDNGTFAPGVKFPFDSSRAKGYVYQTGVWVPLIVAGPLVASPGREVTSMVNIADLFQLFGQLAGVDVHKVVPKSHILDSQSMLPYLTNVNQPNIRQTQFHADLRQHPPKRRGATSVCPSNHHAAY
jgi:arylsulfatase A-like enzyme